MDKEPRQAGLDVRRAMFGPEHAERALERATDFTRPMQELVTKYCFGEVWTREELPRKVRSMLTLAILVGLGALSVWLAQAYARDAGACHGVREV